MDDILLKQFLKRIAQIESSGGTNTKHKKAQHGIHKGTAAFGTYGLMPNTIQEIVTREKGKGSIDPEIRDLHGKSPAYVFNKLKKNSGLEEKLAKAMATRLLQRHQNNDAKAAFAWNQGSNLASDEITPSAIAEKEYTQKYLELRKQEQQEMARENALRRLAAESKYVPVSQQPVEPEEPVSEDDAQDEEIQPVEAPPNVGGYRSSIDDPND